MQRTIVLTSKINQGKTLKKLVECHTYLHGVLEENAVRRYSINLDDLPPSDDEEACAAYEAPLCRDFNSNSKPSRNTSGRTGVMPVNLAAPVAFGAFEMGVAMTTEAREDENVDEGPAEGETGDTSYLVSAPFLSTFELLNSLRPGNHRSGYSFCYDPARRNGSCTIPQEVSSF